jgi:carbon storage regulator
MLVLSRKIGESIIIGDAIRVTVVEIGQGRVKIGVHAPDAVSVDREEIHERKVVERELTTIDLEAAIPLTVHNRLQPIVDVAGATPAPKPRTLPGGFRSKPR